MEKCGVCYGEGFLEMIDVSDASFTKYSFRCYCKKGETEYANLPQLIPWPLKTLLWADFSYSAKLIITEKLQ